MEVRKRILRKRLRLTRSLELEERNVLRLRAGDVVTLTIAPTADEPEPTVPADLRKTLAAAAPKARKLWSDITPVARRDSIEWITSAKQPETRAPDQECLLDARGREATRLLLRPLWLLQQKFGRP